MRERECEAELRGTHSQAELGNDTERWGAVAVCFEGCCGSMCWPRERPATHAAAGAAARGGFNPLRGATTGVVIRRRATSGEMARGGLVFVFSLGIAPVSGGVGAGARGGFNPLRGATTGVVIRRRATSGEMARGGIGNWLGCRLNKFARSIMRNAGKFDIISFLPSKNLSIRFVARKF